METKPIIAKVRNETPAVQQLIPVLGYGRASTTKQEMSIERQRDAIHRYIVYQNTETGEFPPSKFEYIGFLSDEDVSGAVPLLERPEGQKIPMLTCDTGGVLVVASHDRAFRSTIDMERTIVTLTELRIRSVYLNCNLDTGTKEGMFAMRVLTAAAELERATIRHRTMCGRIRKVRDRGFYDKAPLGWKKINPNGNSKQGYLAEWTEQRACAKDVTYVCCERGVSARDMYPYIYEREMHYNCRTGKQTAPAYSQKKLCNYMLSYLLDFPKASYADMYGLTGWGISECREIWQRSKTQSIREECRKMLDKLLMEKYGKAPVY